MPAAIGIGPYGCVRNGRSVTFDASGSYDSDDDKLNFKWWNMLEAGTYKGKLPNTNANSKRPTIKVPSNAAGKSFHIIICDVVDVSSPNLTGYRRIIFEPAE